MPKGGEENAALENSKLYNIKYIMRNISPHAYRQPE